MRKRSNQKPYQSWVTLLGNPPQVKGYLKETSNDTIKIISDLSDSYYSHRIALHDIHKIEFRRENNSDKKILLGALTGFLIGGTFGYVAGHEGDFLGFNEKGKMFFFGLMGAVPGALIGGVGSFAKIEIPINGRTDFDKKKLEKYKVPF